MLKIPKKNSRRGKMKLHDIPTQSLPTWRKRKQRRGKTDRQKQLDQRQINDPKRETTPCTRMNSKEKLRGLNGKPQRTHQELNKKDELLQSPKISTKNINSKPKLTKLSRFKLSVIGPPSFFPFLFFLFLFLFLFFLFFFFLKLVLEYVS